MNDKLPYRYRDLKNVEDNPEAVDNAEFFLSTQAREPSAFIFESYKREVTEALGSQYKLETGGGLLGFCQQSWENGDVPVFYGPQGMGKTSNLAPYLLSNGADRIIELGEATSPIDITAEKVVMITPIKNLNNSQELENYIDDMIRSTKTDLDRSRFKARRVILRPSREALTNLIRNTYGKEGASLAGLDSPRIQEQLSSIGYNVFGYADGRRVFEAGLKEIDRLALKTNFFQENKAADLIFAIREKFRKQFQSF